MKILIFFSSFVIVLLYSLFATVVLASVDSDEVSTTTDNEVEWLNQHPELPAESGKEEDGLDLSNITKLLNRMIFEPSNTNPALYRHKETLQTAVSSVLSASDSQSRLLAADLMTFGYFGVQYNPQLAFDNYLHAVNELGSPRSHLMTAFYYSTGLGGVAERSLAKSLVYYHFAATGNDVMAHMALGYRYAFGLGVETSCETAVGYYKKAADLEAAQFESGLKSAYRPTPLKISLLEENGGLYGAGASYPAAEANENVSIDDLIQYHQHNADRGDANSQVILGQLYYFGRHGLERSYDRAIKYFRMAASILPPTPLQKLSPGSPLFLDHQMKAAAQSVTFLGNMFWHGHGLKQDNATAAKFFKQASEYGNSDAMNNLGIMYLNGIVVKRDLNKAFKYFKKAADNNNPDGMVNLARIYLSLVNPDIEAALLQLNEATKRGSFLALYELGKIHMGGRLVGYSCQNAMMFFKAFAERTDFDRPYLEEAYEDFTNQKYQAAFVKNLMAAELGYEIAHTNVAYMLEKGYITFGKSTNDSLREALVHYQRSANMGNVEARVKVGDFVYEGLGTGRNRKLALSFYQTAAENGNSAIGWFNLGYMHQQGVEITRDLHLAKRYYDRVLEVNPSAKLPIFIAQIYIRILHFFDWLFYGGSFYLDVPSAPPPSSTPVAEQVAQKVETAIKSESDEDESLLAEIKKAQEERIRGKDDGDWENMRAGGGDWDEEYAQNHDDSDVSMILLLFGIAVVLLWIRQQQLQLQQQREAVRPLQPQ